MSYFSVIDTETNWHDEVMSIGMVVADEDTFEIKNGLYVILAPEFEVGGMFGSVLFKNIKEPAPIFDRAEAIRRVEDMLAAYNTRKLFAYNANFDFKHLPELCEYDWYDIIRIAAYKQFNPRITAEDDCCKSGRLRGHYGVESMLRRLTDDSFYNEEHNALYDAYDELHIMRLLGHHPNIYIPLKG